MNGEIIASSRVVNGQCTLEFPALSNVGQADLVIMGYNKVTYRSTIDVIVAEGAYITLNAFEMGVDQANYGETIDMNINIKNVGVEAAQNLTATLSTSSEYVEILSGECAVSAIDPDEVVTLEGFQFSVAEDVPDKTDAPFTLSITDGTNTWESTFTVKLHAPVITVESVQAYMEEEMRYLQFSFQNTGSAPFYGGTLNIYSSSADITIDPTTIVFEDVIEGGEAISLTTNYVVDENVVPGSTYEIAYDMTSGLYNASGIYILSIGAIQEDFESGEFGSQWTMGPEHPWVITEGGVKGYYCAKSGNSFVHNSESYMVLTVEVLAPGELTFSYKVSSENNYDKLRFYMDNQEKGNWSGTVEWSQFTQPVTAGTHSFKWSYSKDSSVSSGSDCAWIDDIVFPPTSVVTFIEPISNLEASVELGMVTLTWSGSEDATSYIVMCDGEEVSTVTDTVFSEIKSEGQYVYSIIAKNDENQTSVPTSITVVVDDYTYVAENNNLSVRVYPNPVSNTLFIEGVNTTYSYVMYNNMGQQVANGRAQGVKQINVNGMSKGVYFLHVTTGAQVSVQKVVVE